MANYSPSTSCHEREKIIQHCSKYVALVSVSGPDPREIKAASHEFYQKRYPFRNKQFHSIEINSCITIPPHHMQDSSSFTLFAKQHTDGTTTLSASGVLINPAEGIFITSGSILYPFLNRSNYTSSSSSSRRRGQRNNNNNNNNNNPLLPGTRITVSFHDPNNATNNSSSSSSSRILQVSAHLVGFVQETVVDQSLQQLTNGSANWQVGWQRSYFDNNNNNNSQAPASTQQQQQQEACTTAPKLPLRFRNQQQQQQQQQQASMPAVDRKDNAAASTADGNTAAAAAAEGYTAPSPAGAMPRLNTPALFALVQVKPIANNNNNSSSSSSSIAHLMGISSSDEDIKLATGASSNLKYGEDVIVIGSPFGIISPLKFLNSATTGIISNLIHFGSGSTSTDNSNNSSSNNNNSNNSTSSSGGPHLILTDARMLPGNEGGGVFNSKGELVGIATLPLKNLSHYADLNIAVCWDSIEPAINKLLAEFAKTNNINQVSSYVPRGLRHHRHHHDLQQSNAGSSSSGSFNFEDLRKSLVLVEVGSLWATGIVISNDGYVLINEHLVRPYLSRKEGDHPTKLHYYTRITVKFDEDIRKFAAARQQREQELGSMTRQQRLQLQQQASATITAAVASTTATTASRWPFGTGITTSSNATAALSCPQYEAELVFVSRGPLDLALIKIKNLPPATTTTTTTTTATTLFRAAEIDASTEMKTGQSIYAMGYPLFEPHSAVRSTICKGILSKIGYVDAKSLAPSSSSPSSFLLPPTTPSAVPAVLQTDAAVHKGISGGMLVNEMGALMGVIICNVKLNKGTTIVPSLNFSLPVSLLAPVKRFIETKDPTWLEIYNEPNEALAAAFSLAGGTQSNIISIDEEAPSWPVAGGGGSSAAVIRTRDQKMRTSKFITQHMMPTTTTTTTNTSVGNRLLSKM